MNFHRIALIVAVLAVPCTANAFWFGSNGSCGGCSSCAPAAAAAVSRAVVATVVLSVVASAAFSRMVRCGSCGGFSMGCGCQSSCGCESSCGCGHESCGCSKRSGAEKFAGAQEQPPEITSPNEGKAFGYSWQWKFHGDVDPIDSRPALVESLLPETGVGLIAGQWGVFKTFIADDLAAAVMTDGVFIKFPVRRKGAVLFFACEGQSEVAIQITAAYEARGGTGKAPFAWVENCPRLLGPNADKILAAMVKQAAEHMMRELACRSCW